METTLFCSVLVIAGAIVYLAYDDAGAFLIAAGCAVRVGRWLDRTFFKPRILDSREYPKQDKQFRVADWMGVMSETVPDLSTPPPLPQGLVRQVVLVLVTFFLL